MSTTASTDREAASSAAWLASFRQYDHPAAAETLPRGLAKLVSWPDLSEMPDELIGPAVRICALLWRKPTASYLIARAIGIDPPTTAAMLRLLQARGHVELMAVQAERGDETAAAPVEASAAAPKGERASFIGKLWHRLLG